MSQQAHDTAVTAPLAAGRPPGVLGFHLYSVCLSARPGRQSRGGPSLLQT